MLLLIVYERVLYTYIKTIYHSYCTSAFTYHIHNTHTRSDTHIHTPTPTHAHVSVDETELVWIEIVPSSCVTITITEPPLPSSPLPPPSHPPTYLPKLRNGEITTSGRTAVVVQPQHVTILRRRRTHVYQYHYTSVHNAFLSNNRSRI